MRRAGLALFALLVGCGESGPSKVEAPVQPAASASTASARAPELDDAAWGKFHSERFSLTIPLPEGRSWAIDDHTGRELVATHEKTRSRLVVYAFYENELMSRARCEGRARELGLVPEEKKLSTVERTATVGPDAYDTGVWVAVEKRQGPLVGHLFLFSAFVRRCLVVHLATEVPGEADEGVLSSRLAIARVKLLGGIKVDPPRTTDDVPREKPPR